MSAADRPRHALDDPARRDAYVTELFDLIAPRYDRFTRWFSYGMDAGWKREVRALVATALHDARTSRHPVVVDLATGTGDLAIAAHCLAPRGTTVGIDVSRRMLAAATRRAATEAPPAAPGDGGMHFVAGDMARMPVQDASVDLVTAGYGLRNAPDLDAALDEIARVLRPGGHLVTLDFFLPTLPGWRALFLGYLAVMGWIYGVLWHRRPDAYVYIPRSIRRFVTPTQYERALRARGLHVRHARAKLLGGVVVHAAEKLG